MSARKKVAVLISGSGSNLQALIDAAAAPDYPAEIVLVLSNKAEAFGLERAKKSGIETLVIDHKLYASREAFDAAMHDALTVRGIELVCLAGFMRLLSDGFVNLWHNRMINIHPSLLPDFKGAHAHRDVLAAGAKISGCTVHFVRAQMDSGPIIAQATVPVEPGDSEETLAARVLKEEHKLYPAALKRLALGRIRVVNERVEPA